MANDNSNARDGTIARGWWPYTRVAKDYLHVSPDLLRDAIFSGELPAYQKPITRGRKDSNRPVIFVFIPDVDEWIRSTWERATRETLGALT